MSSRGDRRHLVRLPAKLTGNDAVGNRFVQTVFTHDISMRGARLTDVPPLLYPAAVVEVEFRGKRSRYRVAWVGGFDHDEIGVVSLDPRRCIWGKTLPGRPVGSMA